MAEDQGMGEPEEKIEVSDALAKEWKHLATTLKEENKKHIPEIPIPSKIINPLGMLGISEWKIYSMIGRALVVLFIVMFLAVLSGIGLSKLAGII